MLSKILESSSIKVIVKKKREAWLKDNNKALQDYNKRIEQRGVFSDGMRNF